MFACICRAVTSDEVGAAIDSGAATLASVAKVTGACTRCGICRDRIRGMISEKSSPCPRVEAPAALWRARVRRCAETTEPSNS